MEEALRQKHSQFEIFQREFEIGITPKIEERIKNEKVVWEQEQNALIRKELAKLGEEKSREIEKIQQELSATKEKVIIEKERSTKLEKQVDELNQEQKFLNKEKQMAISKARDSFRGEIEKIKADAQEVNYLFKDISKLKLRFFFKKIPIFCFLTRKSKRK